MALIDELLKQRYGVQGKDIVSDIDLSKQPKHEIMNLPKELEEEGWWKGALRGREVSYAKLFGGEPAVKEYIKEKYPQFSEKSGGDIKYNKDTDTFEVKKKGGEYQEFPASSIMAMAEQAAMFIPAARAAKAVVGGVGTLARALPFIGEVAGVFQKPLSFLGRVAAMSGAGAGVGYAQKKITEEAVPTYQFPKKYDSTFDRILKDPVLQGATVGGLTEASTLAIPLLGYGASLAAEYSAGLPSKMWSILYKNPDIYDEIKLGMRESENARRFVTKIFDGIKKAKEHFGGKIDAVLRDSKSIPLDIKTAAENTVARDEYRLAVRAGRKDDSLFKDILSKEAKEEIEGTALTKLYDGSNMAPTIDDINAYPKFREKMEHIFFTPSSPSEQGKFAYGVMTPEQAIETKRNISNKYLVSAAKRGEVGRNIYSDLPNEAAESLNRFTGEVYDMAVSKVPGFSEASTLYKTYPGTYDAFIREKLKSKTAADAMTKIYNAVSNPESIKNQETLRILNEMVDLGFLDDSTLNELVNRAYLFKYLGSKTVDFATGGAGRVVPQIGTRQFGAEEVPAIAELFIGKLGPITKGAFKKVGEIAAQKLGGAKPMAELVSFLGKTAQTGKKLGISKEGYSAAMQPVGRDMLTEEPPITRKSEMQIKQEKFFSRYTPEQKQKVIDKLNKLKGEELDSFINVLNERINEEVKD